MKNKLKGENNSLEGASSFRRELPRCGSRCDITKVALEGPDCISHTDPNTTLTTQKQLGSGLRLGDTELVHHYPKPGSFLKPHRSFVCIKHSNETLFFFFTTSASFKIQENNFRNDLRRNWNYWEVKDESNDWRHLALGQEQQIRSQSLQIDLCIKRFLSMPQDAFTHTRTRTRTHAHLNNTQRSWNDGLAVKRACCSSKKPELGS